MQNLEIVTAHNITILAETAELNKRVMATVIDYVLIGLSFLILSSLVSIHESFNYLLVYPFIVFYHLGFEVFNKGQSPGKKLLKIKVISLKGGIPNIEDSLIRWVFRIVDVIGSLGLLGSLMIISTEKNQRIGDILAQTAVIKLPDESPITLDGIEKIGLNKPLHFKYPKVTQFNDEDFLFVKKAINRYEQQQSQTNRKIVIDLATEIAHVLDVDLHDQNELAFLKETMKEYILLTR